MAFAIGNNVGPYRIVDQIGQGGMATVYKAYHANLDRYVAFKVLHPAFKEDPGFLERFKREAQIIARLEHPSIVPVYDFADHENQPYLVMKFIEGETLKARLKRAPLTLDETVTTLEAVANALTYAHRQGVLHRDIKPSNIMLDTQNTPYLTDFGLARIAQVGESTLSQDMMLGTPQYMSPEQAKGMRDLGPGTDIYSLGVVLYEIVVGRVPFSADTPYAIVHDHIYKPLPLPTKINPEVPDEVERVLLKALAKEPQDRYESAVEMVAAFEAAVQSAGMTELSAARYRAPAPPVLSTAATAPGAISPQPAQTPFTPAIPSPVTGTAGSSASRTAYRRRANLWILSGFGSLLVLCLASMFVILGAISDDNLRPWDITDAEEETETDDPLNVDASVVESFNTTVDQAQGIVEEAAGSVANNPAMVMSGARAHIETGNQNVAFSSVDYAFERWPDEESLYAETAAAAADDGYTDLTLWIYLHFLVMDDVDGAIQADAEAFMQTTVQTKSLEALEVTALFMAELTPAETEALVNSIPDEPFAPLFFTMAQLLISDDPMAVQQNLLFMLEELDPSSEFLAMMARFAATNGYPDLATLLYLNALVHADVSDEVRADAAAFLMAGQETDPDLTLELTSGFMAERPFQEARILTDTMPNMPAMQWALSLSHPDEVGPLSPNFFLLEENDGQFSEDLANQSGEELAAYANLARVKDDHPTAIWLYLAALVQDDVTPDVREEAEEYLAAQVEANPEHLIGITAQFLSQVPPDERETVMAALPDEPYVLLALSIVQLGVDPQAAYETANAAIEHMEAPTRLVIAAAHVTNAQGYPELATWYYLAALGRDDLPGDVRDEVEDYLLEQDANNNEQALTIASDYMGHLSYAEAETLADMLPEADFLQQALAESFPTGAESSASDDRTMLDDPSRSITDVAASAAEAAEQGEYDVAISLYLHVLVRAAPEEDADIREEAVAFLDRMAAVEPGLLVSKTAQFLGQPNLNRDAAITALPNEAYVYLALSLVQASEGRLSNAVLYINSANTAIDDLQATTLLIASTAGIAEAQGLNQAAVWYYLAVLGQDNVPSELRNQAGEFVAGAVVDNRALALSVITAFADRYSDNAYALSFLALAQTTSSRSALQRLAHNNINAAVELDETLAEAYLVRGVYNGEVLGDTNAARTDWETALNLDDAPEWVVREATRLLSETE
ncbi:MAG: serine/threonine protein kinase [Chloroflexi bacterium]|nr:serine/threonine protein kinase [Chloroflexota bacterium]